MNITSEMVGITRQKWEDCTKQDHKGNRSPCVLRQEIEQMEAQPTARQQFVTDYLLVTDNNESAYTIHMRLAEDKSVSKMADKLKADYENAIGATIENLRNMQGGHPRGNITADLMSQLLLGWGTDVFDDIARHYIGLKTESEVA
jgi:hypothetical protein